MAATTTIAPALLIVQTYFVLSEQDGDYYEVWARPAADPDAPKRPFVTRDADLYTSAVDVEDTGVPVAIAWHLARTGDGDVVRVLDGITREPAFAAAAVGR